VKNNLGDRNSPDFVGLVPVGDGVSSPQAADHLHPQDDSSFSTLVASLQRAGQPRLAVELFDARYGEKVKTSARKMKQ